VLKVSQPIKLLKGDKVGKKQGQLGTRRTIVAARSTSEAARGVDISLMNMSGKDLGGLYSSRLQRRKILSITRFPREN